MTPPRRPQRTRVAQQLSRRDWAVLEDLARLRLLSGRQVQRLHLGDGSRLTQARRARALLQRLHELHLVDRLDRRIGGVHAGSGGYVYGLATLGQRLLTKAGPAGGRRMRRPWTPSAAFTDHILAVSELYVQLRELEAKQDTTLLAFEAEPASWRPWTHPTGEQLLLKPDAFTTVQLGDVEHVSFVELDRSTQSRPVIRRKAETYIGYWHSGTEQQRHDVFPKVLFVVPDDRRKTQIVDVLSRLDADSWRLFQVCRDDQAAAVLTGRPPPNTAPRTARLNN